MTPDSNDLTERVKRLEAELAASSRELQIERALDEVRKVAMNMKRPEDMVQICRTICSELEKLDVKEIRNVQTAVFYESKHTYNNYIYFRLDDAENIQEVDYSLQEDVNNFANKMLQGTEEFFTTSFDKARLNEYLKYQEETNLYVDKHLKTADSLHFYFYSIGMGALGLSTYAPLSEEMVTNFKRFRNVFELAYRRFTDIEQALTQAKEAHIETALERVRARAVAMHSSDELVEASDVFFEQLTLLGIETIRTGIGILNVENETFEVWSRAYTGEHSEHKILGIVPKNTNKFFMQCFDAWKNKDPYFISCFNGREVKEFYESMRNILSYPERTEYNKEEHFSIFFFPEGSLNVVSKQKLSDDELTVLRRFAAVFGLMYRRFLDLKTAEEQAREANIETSLERIRAAAMSMMKPEDLLNVCETLYKEFLRLGFAELRNAMINIHDDGKSTFTNYDYSEEIGKSITPLYYDIHPVIAKQIKEIRRANDAFSETVFEGEDIKGWIEFRRSRGEKDDPRISELTSLHYYFYSIGNGSIGISTFSPIGSEKLELLKRFRNVFSLSYRRYTDIANAEAQARDAKIEAALERVRSRSTGMRKSEELKDVIRVVFDQFIQLNILVEHSGFIMDYKERDDMLIWLADELQVMHQVTIPYFDSPHWNSFVEAKNKGLDFFANQLSFEEKNKFYQDLFGFFHVPDDAKDFYFNCPGLAISTVLLDNIGLYIENFSGIPYTDEENATLMRFGKVFQQTYTRFLDLQKAEAQAYEAKIEASLERVRSRAMAMHSSDDISSAISAFFQELRSLGVMPWRCGVGRIDKETRTTHLTTTSFIGNGEQKEVTGTLRQEGHPVLDDIFEHWKMQKDYFPVLRGKEIDEYYRVIKPQISYPDYPVDTVQYGHTIFFREGFVFAWTEKQLIDDELNIFRRFASVLSLTYRRFLDLKESEAQAREAKIEAALERVRSRTLAMHSSEELAETAAVVFRQMIGLGISPNRLYIAIIKDDLGNLEFWITDEDGSKVSKDFSVNVGYSSTFGKMYDGWKRKESSRIIDMQGEELEEYFRQLSSLNVPFKVGLSQNRRVQTLAYFSQGFLGIASPEPHPPETIDLLERFASVFNLTYARFNDLKIAEAQAKKSQIETALERVRARALAMQQPEDLNDVEAALRHEMGVLGVHDIETCCMIINDDVTECRYAIRAHDGSSLLTDNFTLDLNDTHSGRAISEFLKSQAEETSVLMQGENRAEWVRYCQERSVPFRAYYTDEIPDRVFHLQKFSHGAVGTVTDGNISDESRELLRRVASVLSLAYSRYNDLAQARIDLQNLKEEKKRSESLLLNILPEEVANELKQFGKSYARKHDEVTILFADIKGFSSIAETLSASELVTQLDECFRAFDKIVDKHGLEKIRTIGDAYVCACGLPKPVPDNAAKAVRAALDMLAFIRGFSVTKAIQDLPVFDFRIGIHTGPVITGVVGLKKFTYDIWGDAVNMAARMEQHGETGKINISGSTYALVKDRFTCTHRGRIEAKNKGEVDMYFVEG